MFNKEEFITKFVEAAKNNEEKAMADLAKTVSEESVEFRVQLLEELVAELAKTEANKQVEAGLQATLELMKLAVEQQEAEQGDNRNSSSEEGKDKSEPEEATQDVAADTGADTAQETDASEPESGGYAPATEEKAEKTEQ